MKKFHVRDPDMEIPKSYLQKKKKISQKSIYYEASEDSMDILPSRKEDADDPDEEFTPIDNSKVTPSMIETVRLSSGKVVCRMKKVKPINPLTDTTVKVKHFDWSQV